ncbi:MAG: transposase [bacterium]|nr:transposase [bacterium]
MDNNLIFKDTDDYFRGIFSIYEFNNLNPVTIQERRRVRNVFKNKTSRDPVSIVFKDERNRMVDILCFCLMPNHIHLLIKQLQDNGLVKFMQKFGAGYGGYFNRKHNRQGHVFQSRFNAVPIKIDEQLKVVVAYICTNPLSLKYPEWKKIKIKNSAEAHGFLEDYKWSSYSDLIGIKNFPSVTQRDFLLEIMGGPEGCKNFIKYWIEYKGELKKYRDLFLED